MDSDGSDDEGKCKPHVMSSFVSEISKSYSKFYLTFINNIYYLKFLGDGKNTFRDLVNSSSAKKRKHGGSIASSKRTAMSMASVESRPMKYQTGGSGIHRPLNGNQNAKKFPDYGAEYRAKKGKGDIKRKDKPDPYAYVPLTKESLNKRKRAKYDGQFKGLVKGAQKGSAAGKKSGKIIKKMKHLKM